MSLHVLAYNLRRVINILGFDGTMSAMKPACANRLEVQTRFSGQGTAKAGSNILDAMLALPAAMEQRFIHATKLPNAVQIAMSTFKTKLLRPAQPGKDHAWAFLVLPKASSDKLPRRGRTSVEGTLNGHPFQATLEPDGQLSHWLKVGKALQDAAGVMPGDTVTVQISPAASEPEPQLPDDLRKALAATPAAKSTWDDTTTIARLDWIHWVESAKQAKTRERRVENACDMLASGKKRVCCFDPSGYYSKSLSAPKADK